MKSMFIFMTLALLSVSTYARDCASSFEQLKEVIGNADLPKVWKENGKDPLTLTLKNSSSKLLLNFTKSGSPWADVTGVICRKGDTYVATVDNIVWGSASPSMVRRAKLKEIVFKMPYQTILKTKVSLFSFEFSPLP